MPRPREFDTDHVLERAMEVFWLHGYDGTSIPMLLEAMGIGRQSLYDTFGGKRELFTAAIERYDNTVTATVLPRLLAENAGIDAIRAHFEDTVVRLTAGGPRKSCFVANCTMELAALDPELAGVLSRSVARMESALRHAVERGQQRGEIPIRRDARVLARCLKTLVLGLTVAAKSGASRRELRETVAATLDVLI